MAFIGGGLIFDGTGNETVTQKPTMPIVLGALYHVSIIIDDIRAGSVRVWVGGASTDLLTTPGEHTGVVTAGDTQEIAVESLMAIAEIRKLDVRRFHVWDAE